MIPLAIVAFGGLLFAVSWAASNMSGSSASAAAPAAPSGGGSATGTLPDPASASGSVIKQVAAVFEAAGMTPAAAAGVIGNAKQESSWNPASVGDGGGGLWGFTSGAESLSSLQAYAHQKNVAWTNPTLQAEFLLQNLPSGDITSLNQQGSPSSAAEWFMTNWEKPYVPTENLATRQQGAQEAYGIIGGGG